MNGTLLHVDLCTGLGGWRAPFEESDAWTSVGIDVRDDLNADVVGDVRSLPFDCETTLLTASPPCTAFSRHSMPWLHEPHPSMELVEACLDAVDELDPEWWVLENVRGLKQYWGERETKRVGPYYLWGEFPPFDVQVTDGGKMQTSGEYPEERAKIPYELSNGLRNAVEWATGPYTTETAQDGGLDE